ncbi:isoamylase early set domain-containing protein [Nitrospira sp. BLG_1]|uniref:isoamylase early set domain-containing protein n=1 Tax=Nitrospira sp. BLG_1 TaxID=3395883 RepID=UPI0039BC8999
MGLRLNGLRRFSRTTLIMIMVLYGFLACVKPPGMKPSVPTPLAGAVRFTLLAPGATQVVLVGSFNGWATDATPMTIVEGALWSVTVPLNPGEYPFMFVIDGGQWITPPHAEDFVTDGFGQTNGVVIVR